MTDREESFVARWSRRKREEAPPVDATDPVREPPGGEAAAAAAAGGEPSSAESDRRFDPESLPPIDSIDAATDIRRFLESGVPAVLKRAALRRAWSADPGIRDFVGLSENAWDFNAPDTIPGFGSLGVSETARRLMASAVWRGSDLAATSAPPAPERAPDESGDFTGRGGDAEPPVEAPRSQPKDNEPDEAHRAQRSPDSDEENMKDNVEITQRVTRRGHGGALPE